MPAAQPIPAGGASAPSSERSFVGAVLCGGASRRMGRDKALLPVGGRPLAMVAIEALRAAGAHEVLTIGGEVGPLRSAGVRLVPDRHPGEGPLGGIVTALAATHGPIVVVLTCDLPAITAEEVRAVVEALEADPSACCAAPVIAGRPQFLTAAYRPEALVPLEAAFAAGERAVRRAVLPLAWTAVAGLEPLRLRDADTPADLPPDVVGSPQPGE